MAGPFSEPPYPQLQTSDVGPGAPYRAAVHHGGRMVVIGDSTDLAFRKTPTLVVPTPGEIDVVIHGLPGRFIERFGGRREIPIQTVAELLAGAGIARGSPLRLLTCHAAEAPLHGQAVADQLAKEWGATVSGPNGLLHIRAAGFQIDLVEWDPDPMGGLLPVVTGTGRGVWLLSRP